MDVTFNRLKKVVESRHGDVTFDKLGAIVVTCMEFVEHSIEDLNGQEKEEWVVEAVDKIWYEQTDKHIVIKKSDKGKNKQHSSDDTSQGDIEQLIRQLIQQICIATKGGISLNNFKTDLKKSNTGRFTGTFKRTGKSSASLISNEKK